MRVGSEIGRPLFNWFQRSLRGQIDFWSVSTFLITLLILVPLGVVLVGLFAGGPNWEHVASTTMGTYVANTAILVVAVTVLCIFMAVPQAWLVSAFEFPGRRFFEWALVMPLAVPTYVAAFAYFQIPEAAIPLLVKIRQSYGIEVYQWSEKVLRYGLLSLVLAGVLFPYLFISTRASFAQQRRAVIEVAQTLGRGPSSTFFTVALPLARPAIIAGLSLVLMEVVNDYGAVHFFGVPTLTEGIFRTWFGLGDRASALRLAGMIMLVIFIVLYLENAQRGRARYAELAVSHSPLTRRRLGPFNAALAFGACLLPLAVGLIFPAWRLVSWASLTFTKVVRTTLWDQLGHSLLLSLLTAIVLTGIAIIFAFAGRLHRAPWLHGISRLATLGYAAPGAVVAVAVMVVFGGIDSATAAIAGWLGTESFLISGTILAIGFAYLVRFLAVAFQPIRAGMTKVCGSLDEASRVLGKAPLTTLFRINLPIMRGTIFAAAILVFVDLLKELPLTLILRPANFETLATTAFGLAKEGRIQECSVPSLIIILVGALGLVALNRFMGRQMA